MDRRTFIGSVAALPAGARAAETAAISSMAAQILPLWPGPPPGASATLPTQKALEQSPDPGAFHDRVLDGIAEPLLYVVQATRSNGSALLVVPGGGYREIWIDNEGFDVAATFAAKGITCFVLVYRLPAEGWLQGPDVPLQDTQRAMRLIRANATQFGVNADRVGTIGFSAGGHVAASLATRSATAAYNPIDAMDGLSPRPDFVAILYSVVTMLPPFAHEASREMLLGANPSTELRTTHSCEKLVTAETPPMFLVHALDDDFVAPDNTLLMLSALRANNVPAECHLFERGGHGFAIRGAAGLPVSAWPDLFWRWGTSHGYFRTV